MSTYKRTKINYRKIYEENFGPIPVDSDGRTYEIHHIDGNHDNNDPSNLKAVSIQEHYEIHYSQGDYWAALRIAEKMKLSKNELSSIATLNNKKRVKNGTHPFQTKTDGTNLQTEKVKDGIHHFLLRNDGTSLSSDLVAAGTHHLLKQNGGDVLAQKNNQIRVEKGTHNLLKREDGGSVGKDNQHKLVKEGKHWFSKREDGSSIGYDMVKNGTHPFLAGKGTVPCIDKEGKYIRVLKNDYYSQFGPMENWEWVNLNSKEGKRRRNKF